MELPKLPKLQPVYARREDEPGYEAEIWKPDWKCFCCHDTGEVVSSLAALVIEGFDSNRCLLPLCQKMGCAAGSALREHPTLKDMLDKRFTPAICNELHLYSFNGWMNITKENQKEAAEKFNKKQQELADKRTMPGTRGRTDNDDREAEIKKQEAQAALDKGVAERIEREAREAEERKKVDEDFFGVAE